MSVYMCFWQGSRMLLEVDEDGWWLQTCIIKRPMTTTDLGLPLHAAPLSWLLSCRRRHGACGARVARARAWRRRQQQTAVTGWRCWHLEQFVVIPPTLVCVCVCPTWPQQSVLLSVGALDQLFFFIHFHTHTHTHAHTDTHTNKHRQTNI